MAVIKADGYNVCIDESWQLLNNLVAQLNPSSIFVFVDENTTEHCLRIFHDGINFKYKALEISSGEENKTIATCQLLWNKMIDFGADRSSLVINLGGGVLGDLGGFVASTYMRGIKFIQIPTSLLSQVDASVGGKLGVDQRGFKNMIGLFNNPEMVFIKSEFLKTLPARQLRSGFAEIIKHSILHSEDKWKEISKITALDKVKNWGEIIEWNVDFKNKIVQEDFRESGKRKLLNFGHTIGHAIETANLNSESTVFHGEAIAIGMIIESYIAHFTNNLEYGKFIQIKDHILSIYDHLKEQITPHIDIICALATADKKNTAGNILISTISNIGEGVYDVGVDVQKIKSSITSYCNQIRS